MISISARWIPSIRALKANWEGYEILQAQAKNRAPKYGRDDDAADALALRFMRDWSDIVWGYRTKSTNAQFRPGMLSWNYWIGSGFILPLRRTDARAGSSSVTPSVPSTARTQTVPQATQTPSAKRSVARTRSATSSTSCPTARATRLLSPSLMRDRERREKLKAFLRGYTQNGGTALQINILDAETLKDAQKHPENYKNLLVRITGYNAYFTSIGRELQNEIIARESHNRY
ncbi:MAG: glycine radical domain-containing protein [Eubacteriales bacterium]